MQLQEEFDTTVRYDASVLSSERLTPADAKVEVREIAVEVNSPDYKISVGQNLGVLAPGQLDIGQEFHFRLYSVADIPQTTPEGHQRFRICVRRCFYIDQFSGEEYPGIASNYLCDLDPGDSLTITGPYGQAFQLPRDTDATLILIVAGTGIAPFRAFVKHIYKNRPDFAGRIILFHGGETGLDLLYRNDEKDDFSLYYDRDTFQAFNALSKRPGWSDSIDWGSAMAERAEELRVLLSDPKTYVYVAGLQKIRDELDSVLNEVVGPSERWSLWKAELEANHRWTELLY